MSASEKKVRVICKSFHTNCNHTFSEQGVIVLRSGELSSKVTKDFFAVIALAKPPEKIALLCIDKFAAFFRAWRLLGLSAGQ